MKNQLTIDLHQVPDGSVVGMKRESGDLSSVVLNEEWEVRNYPRSCKLYLNFRYLCHCSSQKRNGKAAGGE